MAKILGVGGVFVHLNQNVKSLLNWYDQVLGLDVSEYGLNFLVPNALTLISFEEGEGQTSFNFTVDHLEDYIKELKMKQVVILEDIKEQDIGKFAVIADPFGQKIELWEPKTQEYIAMVNDEIKQFKSE
ncbi:MAG: VOC family protein [Clostridia bacterium]|nr:VOC family protein [Clostridia bacterium]